MTSSPAAIDTEFKRNFNGKLSRELFEAAGLTVAEQAPAESTLPVGTIQPGKMDVIRAGEQAMECLAGKRTWASWVAIMMALDAGRTTAMQEARANKPNGTRYHTAIAKWFRLHPTFDNTRMHKTDRSRLLKCFDNLAAIESWREAQIQKKPQRALHLNNPFYVLRCWGKKKKQVGSNGDGAPQSDASSSPLTPKLSDIWPISTEEEKRAELKRENRSSLITLLAQTEFADHALAQREFADRACLQEINSTSMPKKNVVGDVRVALTRIVREIASAPTPERRANAAELLKQKCAVNKLHPSKLVVGHQDYTPPLTAQRAAKRKNAREL